MATGYADFTSRSTAVTRYSAVLAGLVCSALACLSACAASPPPATRPPCETCREGNAPESREAQKSAARPDGASAEEVSAARGEAAPAPPAAAPAEPMTDVARKEAPGAADPHGDRAGARRRLSEARRELEIATNERDCARACRALESMERAMQQVCELARSPEERRECTSAGEQVDKARTKVQSACGGCPQKLR